MRYLALIACTLLALSSLQGAEHDHDHGQAHGTEHALGAVNLAGTDYRVVVAGEVEAGHEAVILASAAAGQTAHELRVWIGIQNGRGSVKALIKPDEHGHYHGHLEVPATLMEGAALWLEAVDTDGNRLRASLALPADGHAHVEHHDDDGHDHAEHGNHDQPAHGLEPATEAHSHPH